MDKALQAQFPAKPKYSNLRFITSHSLAIGDVNIHCLFENSPMKHIYWKHMISVIMPFPSTMPQASIFQSLPTLYVLPFRGAISPPQKKYAQPRGITVKSCIVTLKRRVGTIGHQKIQLPWKGGTLPLWYVVLGVGCPCKYQPYKLPASVRNWILGVWFCWWVRKGTP